MNGTLPPITGITKRQAKALLKMLGELHEKAYRRGFQHGHLSGSGGDTFEPTPTERQVSDWRHRGYKDCEPPPHGGYKKRKKSPHTVVARMMMESTDDINRWLRQISHLAGN